MNGKEMQIILEKFEVMENAASDVGYDIVSYMNLDDAELRDRMFVRMNRIDKEFKDIVDLLKHIDDFKQLVEK